MKAIRLVKVPLLCGFFFGYPLGSIGPMLPFVKHSLVLTAWESGHLVSLFIIGLMMGAFSTYYVLQIISRNNLLKFLSLSMVVLALFGFLASDFWTFAAFRVLTGFVSGTFATLGPMIVVDNAEPSSRARLTCLFQLSIVVGVALSYLMGVFIAKNGHFKWLIVMQGLLGLFSWALLRTLGHLKHIESPRSLDLSKIKGSLLVAGGLNFFQQASGINALTFFIQSLLIQNRALSHQTLFALPLVFNVVSFLTTTFVFAKIRKSKRKPFLILGALGMALCLGVVALCELTFWGKFTAFTGYIAFFALSFGPLVYLVTNEVFDDRYRAKGASLSFFINCLTNYLISLIFLPLSQTFGACFMWGVFSVACLLAALFVYTQVPETKGCSPDTLVKKLNH